eukprot:5103132-Amphidinium_carterae.4
MLASQGMPPRHLASPSRQYLCHIKKSQSEGAVGCGSIQGVKSRCDLIAAGAVAVPLHAMDAGALDASTASSAAMAVRRGQQTLQANDQNQLKNTEA